MIDNEESSKFWMYLAFVANHLSYHAKAIGEAHLDPLTNEMISVVLHLGKKRKLLCC